MLKIILGLCLLLSLSAHACWKVEGSFAVDGETWKINQKFDHDKDYMFSMGTFILKLRIGATKNKKNSLQYSVQEKKGTTLGLITKGEEDIEVDKTKEIFAKGEEGQPNSILTIKMIHI